jgi:hypothetical protein
MNGGSVSGSYAWGSVSATGDDAGGLVGYNSGGKIVNSYATGKVSAGNDAGGLVGAATGMIVNSYATGRVSAGNDAGGLVGLNSATGMIATSYATGSVTGTSNVGGLIGADPSSGSVSGSFWNITTSGLTTSAAGTGLTTAQMQTEANFDSATSVNGYMNPGWNFTSIWYMTNGVTFPMLRGVPAPAVTAKDASPRYEDSAYRGGR